MQKIFQIDSHKRLSGTHSFFNYKMDLSIFHTPANLQACITKCSIPRSYYLVRPSMNAITLTENGTTYTITIPVGNYNTNTFRTALLALLNPAAPRATQGVYTVELNPQTGKFTYTSTVPATLTFPTAVGSSIHEQFGFNAGDTVTLPIASSNVVKFISEDMIIIRSTLVNSEGEALLSVNASGTPDFGTVGYECPNPILNARPLRSTSTNVFSFRITDPDGIPLDTNGLPCFFEILVWRPYENVMLDIMKEIGPRFIDMSEAIADL